MRFYPYTLKSQWYMEDVCDYIFASLEGAKTWTAQYCDNKYQRKAFLETFEECQVIVKKNDLKPEAMLQALSDFHDKLQCQPKPPFFSIERWFYDPILGARDSAVRVVLQLVDGISKRFLP
jgi:hypothetical protein